MKTGKNNSGKNISIFFVLMGSLLFLAGCGGSGAGSNSSSNGGVLTLTGFAGVSTIPDLAYSSIISNSGTKGVLYSRVWTTPNNKGLASLAYLVNSTEVTLNFDVTADASVSTVTQVWYYAANAPLTNTGFCWVSGTTNTASLPLCTSLNISVNRAAGTIAFASSPAVSYTSGSSVYATGTMSGTLSFTPF